MIHFTKDVIGQLSFRKRYLNSIFCIKRTINKTRELNKHMVWMFQMFKQFRKICHNKHNEIKGKMYFAIETRSFASLYHSSRFELICCSWCEQMTGTKITLWKDWSKYLLVDRKRSDPFSVSRKHAKKSICFLLLRTQFICSTERSCLKLVVQFFRNLNLTANG